MFDEFISAVTDQYMSLLAINAFLGIEFEDSDVNNDTTELTVYIPEKYDFDISMAEKLNAFINDDCLKVPIDIIHDSAKFPEYVKKFSQELMYVDSLCEVEIMDELDKKLTIKENLAAIRNKYYKKYDINIVVAKNEVVTNDDVIGTLDELNSGFEELFS